MKDCRQHFAHFYFFFFFFLHCNWHNCNDFYWHGILLMFWVMLDEKNAMTSKLWNYSIFFFYRINLKFLKAIFYIFKNANVVMNKLNPFWEVRISMIQKIRIFSEFCIFLIIFSHIFPHKISMINFYSKLGHFISSFNCKTHTHTSLINNSTAHFQISIN